MVVFMHYPGRQAMERCLFSYYFLPKEVGLGAVQKFEGTEL